MSEPWWKTQRVGEQAIRPDDFTTWPGVSPVAALLGGVNGGPNWMPVVSPILQGPVNANAAIGQGIWNGLSGVVGNLSRNPSAAAPATTKAGPQGTPWDFSFPAATGGTPTAAAPKLTAKDVILTLVPGATVTSTDRTKTDQERLRKQGYAPATNSQHLRQGKAVDFVPPKGSDPAALVQQLTAAGMWAYYDPKRGHIHADLRNTPTDDAFTMPQLPTMDPRAANALPLPGPARTIDMPNAPQMPDMPARPLEEVPETDKWMAQLRALAPKAFDEKAANEGRIGAVLAGIAQGAARADARDGVGAMLAMMGAGASAAQAAWVQNVKADKKEADEAVRLFELGMVRQGIDFAQTTSAARMRNRERQYGDQRDKLLTTYNNQQAQWDVETKELLTNNGIMREWDSEMLQARTNRARAALQITESNISTTSRQLMGQAELDLKRFLFEDEKSTRAINDNIAKAVQGVAAGIGIDPKTAAANKDMPALNALQGFAYMAAGNKPAAINTLAREMVLSGRLDLITDVALRKQIELAAKRDPELAAVMVGKELNDEEARTKGSVLGLAKLMAGYGLPFSTAFARLAKPTAPAQTPAQGQ
jgi:hypothetical protein